MSVERTIVRAHRPLRELTDEELYVLDKLGDHASIFKNDDVIVRISMLAIEEINEREYALEMNLSRQEKEAKA